MADLFDLPFEEPAPAAPTRRQRRVLTVSQLTQHVRTLLEAEFH